MSEPLLKVLTLSASASPFVCFSLLSWNITVEEGCASTDFQKVSESCSALSKRKPVHMLDRRRSVDVDGRLTRTSLVANSLSSHSVYTELMSPPLSKQRKHCLAVAAIDSIQLAVVSPASDIDSGLFISCIWFHFHSLFIAW